MLQRLFAHQAPSLISEERRADSTTISLLVWMVSSQHLDTSQRTILSNLLDLSIQFPLQPCQISLPAASTAQYQHPIKQNRFTFTHFPLETHKTNLKAAWILTRDYCCLDHLLTICQDQISCLINTLKPIQEKRCKTNVQLLCQSEVTDWTITRYKPT